MDENLRTGEQKSATAEEKPEQEDSAKETAGMPGTGRRMHPGITAPPSRAQTITKPIRRMGSQRMRLRNLMQSHRPRKDDFLLKMKKAALSVA